MEAENKICATEKIYSLTELLGNKKKPTNERFELWLLNENLHNDNLITNIGDLNYVENEERMGKFKRITEPFCDNIMVFKITDSTDLEGKLLKKDVCGSFNSYLRGKFSRFPLAKHGVKAKLPQLLDSNTITIKGVKQIIRQDFKKIAKKYKKPVAVPYKIELADVKLLTLLEELPEILKQLAVEHYYLLDLDITQDFAGIFNKEEMTEYLTTNYNFCRQKDVKNNCKIIVDNDKTVGKDCLTWINSNSRVKIYNKFVCQMTSPGINKILGNNVVNFVNCPDKRLKETFSSELAKNNGITRLEATIYNYVDENFQNDREFDPLDDCISLLKQSRKYLKNAPFYSVSLAKMWRKITDSLKNSCCLVFNDLLQFVYWGNINTKKLTGIQVKLPENTENRRKMVAYAISAFSFNLLPVNLVCVKEDKNDKNLVKIKQKCYLKAGKTYFSKSNTLFSTVPKEVNLEELGLIKTTNVEPYICRKRLNIRNKLLPNSLEKIDPLNVVFLKSIKKREQELRELDMETRKRIYLEKLLKEQEKYKNCIEKDKKIKEIENSLIGYFSKQWSDLSTKGNYKISAFVVNNKARFSYVGVLAEKDGNKAVYFIKGPFKNKFIELNNNKENLTKEGFILIPYNGLNIVYYPINKPIIEIKTDGLTSFNGHTFPKIVTLNALDIFTNKDDIIYKEEDRNCAKNLRMDKIIGDIRVKNCKRLEDLQEGLELQITALSTIIYRKTERYILKFENVEDCYISNYWLEKEVKDRNIDLNYKLKIKLDKIKTNPNKHAERFVFVG
ncbi:MAG: hypothetical protein KFE23_00475 [Candidatus Baumannia cicadellinicola]|nr:hypothetical protein [Candidatus Baumannia cicadellinicola]